MQSASASSHARLDAAFTTIIEAYQERKHASGLWPMSLGSQSDAGNRNSKTAGYQPSVGDFLVDVEIAAKKCLTESHLDHFSLYYRTGRVLAEDSHLTEIIDVFPESERERILLRDGRVRELLGEQFVKDRIYPLVTYLNPSSSASG